jgi:transcriptional regulator with XRE-family HTH domain
MTPEQLRMARAKLGLSQDEVSERVGLTKKTLSNAETGAHSLSADYAQRLKDFYESCGLEFTDYNGVREKPSGFRTFRGKTGFRDFYEFQFDVIRREGGDLWLYNGVSKLIMDALGADYVSMHRNRMSEIKHRFRYRVIVEEGDDTFFGSDYAHYRWVSKNTFNDKTIFVFGSCVAFVNFEGDISVILIQETEIADTIRNLMENSWNKAWEPQK